MNDVHKVIKIKFFYKLLAAFGILCLIIGITLISGNKTIEYTSGLLNIVVNKQMRSLAQVNQLHYRANKIRLLEVEFSEINDYYTVSGGVDDLYDLIKSFDENLRNFVSSYNSKDDKIEHHLLHSWDLYRKDLEQSLQYMKSMNMAEAKKTSRYSSFPRFQVFSKYLEQVSNRIEKEAQRDYAKAIAELGVEKHIFSLISIMGILGGIIITFILARSLSSRILALRTEALRLADGNMDNPIQVKGNDELADLAVSFNAMRINIQNRENALRSARDKLEERVKERTAELTLTNRHLEDAKLGLENSNKILNKEIVDRKKAEQQLEEVNQELKKFAYVVSHDLKAPLRGIRNLAEWISTDYAEKFNDEGREQINLLMNRVDQMRGLIDGILQYSRIGRVQEERVVVNLNELVSKTIDLLAPPKNITITIEDKLPAIKCEQTRITQVFQNLLSNAIKYMDKPQGQIKIGCTEENGFWKFSVADNGRGIEEQNFEKIFQLFQTIEPVSTSESTGIGLTVIKKIVEMYGGEIWIQSKIGEGSTFFFTLPKQNIDAEKNSEIPAGIVS